MIFACYKCEMTVSPKANESITQVNEGPATELNTVWKLEND